ncbi:hypothetical protein EDD18DRAFT_1113375 [Armillaria luteobubalina]|uniref:Uncharacterized protein n=1 Tax=Armillaria luteobubalina TaxID=153913 RepID=A0AA39PBZ1_9AGAR|nr:hypothetical protein EDD18DRAFT_1113375 [Armillaria luteobubalina]
MHRMPKKRISVMLTQKSMCPCWFKDTQVLLPTTMSTLNACLKVAKIAEASGAPYLENVAKLLKQKGKNKKEAKELCDSIADTIVVIDDLVHMHGDQDTSCYIDICGEMETYLQWMAQDIKDFKLNHCGLRGVFCVDDFRDAIQSYRRHVDDLKMDFVIHSVGDSNLKVMQIHCLLIAQAAVHHPDEFVFQIPKKPVVITAFF